MAFLGTLDQFSTLERPQLQDVCKLVNGNTYSKHETVIIEGTPSPNLYFVGGGRVRCYKTAFDGREQTLFLLGPADSFNHVSLFDNRPSPFSVEATAEGAFIYSIPCHDFLRIATAQYVLLIGALQDLTREMTEVIGLVADLSFLSSASRIAKFLLCNRNGQYKSRGRKYSEHHPVLNITQAELAHSVGCAREHASRSLKSMERSGAIRIDRRNITLIDLDLLEQFTKQSKIT